MEKEARVIRIFPYSYSSLDSYETCPKKHYGEKISKEFERPYNKAADEGTNLHKMAEDYAIHGKDFEHRFKSHIVKVIDELKGKGEFFAEKELAVDLDLKPCGFWDKNCYTRSKIDLLQIGETEATVIDWKTGKADPFSTQLKHNALVVFLNYPQIQKVNTRYEWLKEGYPTKGTVYREFFEQDWKKFEQRVAKLKKSFKANDWPTKRNGLCKNYCGVTTCEFYGKSYR